MAQVLRQLPPFTHPDLIVGTETSDDAGVFRVRPDLAIVNTVDFFTPIVDDPYVFGQIAAANALSDVYAMGGEPLTAMNIVAFPKGTLGLDVLTRVLAGGAERVRAAGAVVVGGHSIIDPELKYGLAVTGVVHPDRVIRNVGVRAGDVLVLTKPLGTGIVSTAVKRRLASAASIRAAVASMVGLNRDAARAMRAFSVHACSDVTGYGLIGHAAEMAVASDVTIELQAKALPALPGARRLAERGVLTGGCRRVRDYLAGRVDLDGSVPSGVVELAYDPQTSGGLLIAVPKRQGDRLVARLHASGVRWAAIVGSATPRGAACVRLV